MTDKILLLFASQTGSAEDVAHDVHKQLTEAGHTVDLLDLSLHEDISNLPSASCILGVVSTWGDGEPPDDAVPFFENLREAEPLGLNGKPVAVLGLGDKGYDLFCECGKELERELQRHGATSMLPRVDCDVWYDDDAAKWTNDLLNAFQNNSAANVAA
ncbi:MAG: flavodoxin domain-containing protein [Verrucomicrobiota bacterium]